MVKGDSLGDRMKLYENFSDSRLLPMVPAMARLDGKTFHTWTKGLRRPYDERLSSLMIDTTKYLVETTNARIGYTQSDEITLVWLSEDFKSEIYFDGRVLKMVSVLAAMCSVYFNKLVAEKIPEKTNKSAIFDCRVWSLPTQTEAANALIWREQDAVRNSIQMAAQSLYSHKELHGKKQSELHDLLYDKGINWNDYPAFFKRGTYVQRQRLERPFTVDELAKLPPKHNAHTDPNLIVSRTEVNIVDLPPLSTIVNREDVVFYGVNPLLYSSLRL